MGSLPSSNDHNFFQDSVNLIFSVPAFLPVSSLKKRPIANAINVLKACIYKSVKTGLILKSAPCVNKFNMLMLVFTLKYIVLWQKSMLILKLWINIILKIGL